MKKLIMALGIQVCLLASMVLADPVLKYECTGFESFNGSVRLVRDSESRLPALDRTYFGFDSHQRENGETRGLVMMVLGRNNDFVLTPREL